MRNNCNLLESVLNKYVLNTSTIKVVSDSNIDLKEIRHFTKSIAEKLSHKLPNIKIYGISKNREFDDDSPLYLWLPWKGYKIHFNAGSNLDKVEKICSDFEMNLNVGPCGGKRYYIDIYNRFNKKNSKKF